MGYGFQGQGHIGGSGTALQVSGDSRVTVSNGTTVRGNVFAIGDSRIAISNVAKIEGDAFADNNAQLILTRTSAQHVGAFTNSTLTLAITNARTVTVDRGTANLEGASIADRIDVFGKGRLSFGGGSTVGGSITNLGDETGLVQINSGSVGGNLVGLASSITAMSGGFVRGSLVLSDQATFLYSGGTFGFAHTSPSDSPDSFASLRSDEGEGGLEMLSTSSGFTALSDATIKFIGFGLQSTLVDPDYLQDEISYSVYQLTGRMADNSSIDGGLVYIQNAAGTASFELIEAPPVPEPSVTALFVIGLACLGFSRRARYATQSNRL